jgi:ABC-type polysaccharide/polyol phosphate export permease
MSGSARPRTSLWHYRSLIWNFAQRDLKSRFKGTALGWAWSLMLPLATLLTYSFVFAVIFRGAPPDFGNGRAGLFAVWLWAGLVPWTFFLIAINVSIPTLMANGPLLQKVYFPSYAPILGAALAILVQSSIELGILALVLLALGNVGLTWLMLPLWAVLFVSFVAAVAVTLAILNVYFRDVAHLVSVALQLLFFLTPIIYQVNLVPETWHGLPLRALVGLNPLAGFVDALRSLIYDLKMPGLSTWIQLTAWTIAALGLAVLVYRARGLDIGESI